MESRQKHVAQIADDPNWLLHRYDETNDQVKLVKVTRQTHRDCTFITDTHLPENLDSIVLKRAELQGLFPKVAPLHFIFHSAYCGSTMLARAFDIEGKSMSLKEPVVLNDLVGWKRRGGEGKKIAEVLDQSLMWLSRPMATNESVVIKPSNVVNCLIPALLAMRPGAKALLLYAPLETFLASIAKKNLWGRLWVRTLLIGQLKDGLIAPFGMTGDDLLQLSDLQVAAVGWVAQQMVFESVLRQYGPDRVRSLSSANLMAEQRKVVDELTTLFDMEMSESEIDALVKGPAFTRHSKLDEDFDVRSREREHEEAVSLHADEIEKVSVWASKMADKMKVPLELGSALV